MLVSPGICRALNIESAGLTLAMHGYCHVASAGADDRTDAELSPQARKDHLDQNVVVIDSSRSAP
jgi:hypothetical protein